jgi:hypothetical protein
MSLKPVKGDDEIVIDAVVTESEEVISVETAPVPRSAALPAAGNVRALARKRDGEMAVRTVALATAGGVVAGAATVVLAKAAKQLAKPTPGLARRRKKDVVASRTFLVDVHLLKPQR